MATKTAKEIKQNYTKYSIDLNQDSKKKIKGRKSMFNKQKTNRRVVDFCL